MADQIDLEEVLRRRHARPVEGLLSRDREGAREKESDEEFCGAFGYLRGVQDRALAVEFRYRDGNSDVFEYSCLNSWRHNPSVGLLLKFTGDVITLILIRGSNLSAPVGQSGANLTDRGLQRHRVIWVREMDEDDLRKAGEGQPTVDRIEVAAFDSHEKLKQWVSRTAPAFAGGPLVPA